MYGTLPIDLVIHNVAVFDNKVKCNQKESRWSIFIELSLVRTVLRSVYSSQRLQRNLEESVMKKKRI